MTEEMSREKAEWCPQWLTIREFLHITPVNLFHKEQEEGEKQSEAEQQLTAELRQNLHVLVRARFTLETAQENLTLRLTADDHYKLYVETGRDLRQVIRIIIIIMRFHWGRWRPESTASDCIYIIRG